MHFSGVYCGISYFVFHTFRPSIAFTMDLNEVFYTGSNGVRVPALVVRFSPKGFIHLEHFKMQSRW